jgi:serpin B
MEKTLHFTLSTDKLSVGYADLLDSLNSRRNNNWFEKPAYELLVANALWGQKGYEFKPAFTQLLQNNYGARLKDVDFAKTEQARKTINDWVAQQTKDKIKDLIPPGAVDNLTRLVLTNAIYFKGKWETKFAKEGTKDGQFKVTAEKSVDVPMMHQLHDFGYTENDDLQMLELPYIQNELSMVIMLPKKIDGLADLEKSLTAASVGKWLKEQRPTPVDVTLPKFTFSSEFMLKDTLKAMGMTDAFDGGKADFTGMTDKEKLFISKVIHKAFVAVDEEGTEAAAATAVVTTPTACPPPEEPKVFKADHPFMFLIRHNSTGEILFMGRVANPKGE